MTILTRLHFRVFNVNKNNIINLFENSNTTSITIMPIDFYGPLTGGSGGFISLSDDSQGYVITQNQVIYKVILNKTTSNGQKKDYPIFQNIYKGWFPSSGFTSISQSIMYKHQLVFLLNNYEVWSLNPNELLVDFTPKRKGGFTIVPL